MRTPPRAKRCQEVIDQMVDWLNFYMGRTQEFRAFVKNDIKYLEEYLTEISEEYKLHDIKLAAKLKKQWQDELDHKNQMIRRLQKEIDGNNSSH